MFDKKHIFGLDVFSMFLKFLFFLEQIFHLIF